MFLYCDKYFDRIFITVNGTSEMEFDRFTAFQNHIPKIIVNSLMPRPDQTKRKKMLC